MSTATTTTLSFTPSQTETLVRKEIEEVGINGVSKVLGTDAMNFIAPEDPDHGTGSTEFLFGDGENEILVNDLIGRMSDPYTELTELLGTDLFIKD